MKIIILSRNKRLYSTRRLVEAARARGHQVRVLDPLHCYMNITSDNPSVRYRGKDVSGYHAVIPRIGASITFYGLAVLRQFEMMNVFALNSSIGVRRSRDKLQSLQLLSREGIGLPATGFAHSPDDISDAISLVGGPAMILKLLEGTQGKFENGIFALSHVPVRVSGPLRQPVVSADTAAILKGLGLSGGQTVQDIFEGVGSGLNKGVEGLKRLFE